MSDAEPNFTDLTQGERDQVVRDTLDAVDLMIQGIAALQDRRGHYDTAAVLRELVKDVRAILTPHLIKGG